MRSLKLYITPAFGAAGRNTGVPWHFHGQGFLEVLHGRKTWFLHAPETRAPQFDANATTLVWVSTVLPTLGEDAGIVQCTLHAGDAIYFPSYWRHATLNLDEWNSWIASFA